MYQSKTNENFVFTTSNFRISFISCCLFRVETNNYTDDATQVIINRTIMNEFPLDIKESNDHFEFETPSIKVLISKNGIVKEIVLKDTLKVVSDFYSSNLKGTARTLDCVNASCPLNDGVISKNGVAVLDDSTSLLIKNNLLYSRKQCSDKYYFAYGNRYQEALDAFYHLTGKVPLIPRYALGNWWSRYHAYSDDEYIELIERFKDNKIPLNVSVIDMDWHYVDNKKYFKDDSLFTEKELLDKDVLAKYYDGWTGYTFNKDLFKDYKVFLKYLHDNNLKVTLNLHPALGVRKYEKQFNDMAKALDIDPSTTRCIDFDVSSPKFMDAYFKILHHPYENEGVDFWWIDWQQGINSNMKFLDPLWALNHFHYLDNDRSNKRPLILSRFSGPGSHRYPLGFSGDTYITWEALKFQPYFTSTATNIGYCWWSHDIGGHMNGNKDNELYIRWLQLGVFSPINRLHSTCNYFSGKEPWKFNRQTKDIAIKYLQFRKGLIPYLYSMNYQTYKNNKALITPMYYHTLQKQAYKYKNQFMFGSELLVMPITSKTNKVTSLANVEGFLPEGTYFDIFTDQIYNGNTTSCFYRDIYSIPVFAKQGSIIPLYADKESNNIDNNQDLEILIYSGNNTFELYEDDGESKEYLNGNYSLRKLIVNKDDQKVTFKVSKCDNPLFTETINRKLFLHFKDIKEATIKVNKEYKVINDKHLVIEVEDFKDEIIVSLTNITYRKNNDKIDSIVNLTSSYQLENDAKLDMFLYYIDPLKYKQQKLPKSLKGPIDEILNLKY